LSSSPPISRRAALALGGAALASAALPQPPAVAQAPRRGGTLTIRAWDPPHFDPVLTISYKTHVLTSFTHSRLVRHRPGPGVKPGSFAIEGDLAESWQQPSDTTYVFRLRRGVRFHPKPPVNGRELTAEDVRFSVERLLTAPGAGNAVMLRAVDRVEAVDRYTVKFTLKEPFAWFLDMLANPMAVAIVPRECVDRFGDLKKPDASIGTGPWMLESYKPNVSLALVRHPSYFQPGLPHIDRVELHVDEDNASRMAAFLAGKYDLGWEFPGTINRTDWVQIRDQLKQRRPGLQTAEFASNVVNDIQMRTDGPPFNDARVRQAISLAVDRQRIIADTLEGAGVVNGPVPAALVDWALPVAQLGEGSRFFRYDPAEARRLLAAAGHAGGLPASVCFATYGSTVLVDTMEIVLRNLKDVGIDAKLDQKEYGAYVSTCRMGKYDSMGFGPAAPFLEPDNFLSAPHAAGEPRNRSHVTDPALTDLLVRQRRTLDVGKRRDMIHEIQRYLARQQYYVYMPAAIYVGVWDRALKNYAPNLGFDYGGRLVAAWLDR
jgi:peptide/nickel transport system substrate-binding protein